VVDLEVLHAESPVTLLAVCLALHLAVLIGTLPADVALYNNNRHSGPCMTYFKKKNFHLSEGPILKFINTNTEKDRNAKR
jgi:hypothetical protein